MWPVTAFTLACENILEKSSNLKFPRTYHNHSNC